MSDLRRRRTDREWTRPSINGNKIRHLQNVRPFFELIFVDSQLNVYAGERDVRPPAAPTTGAFRGARRFGRDIVTSRNNPLRGPGRVSRHGFESPTGDG